VVGLGVGFGETVLLGLTLRRHPEDSAERNKNGQLIVVLAFEGTLEKVTINC
jgi:hypothetical protein